MGVTGGGRALETLKEEAAHRIARGSQPLAGMVGDGQAALNAIDSLARERWASAFSAVAERGYARAAKFEIRFTKRLRKSTGTPGGCIITRAAPPKMRPPAGMPGSALDAFRRCCGSP